MAELGFTILKRVGKTPSMAACERCKMKFFVPMLLIDDPTAAEQHLWQKYTDHKCKPVLSSDRRLKDGLARHDRLKENGPSTHMRGMDFQQTMSVAASGYWKLFSGSFRHESRFARSFNCQDKGCFMRLFQYPRRRRVPECGRQG
jgi:hypothetical protein